MLRCANKKAFLTRYLSYKNSKKYSKIDRMLTSYIHIYIPLVKMQVMRIYKYNKKTQYKII